MVPDLAGDHTHSIELKGKPLFEILFLGTSAAAPSAQRGLSALIVKHNQTRFLS